MRGLVCSTLAIAIIAIHPGALAQSFPAKSIRWISPWPAGGANDIFSRAIGQKVAESFSLGTHTIIALRVVTNLRRRSE